MMGRSLGRPLVLAFVATLAVLSSSHAFDVREGECKSILSGEARVRIHYASGLKAEVDPVGVDNITSQVDIFPDGRRVPHVWTAPCWQGLSSRRRFGRSSHVFGLLMRLA
jgi:hypothetical protein